MQALNNFIQSPYNDLVVFNLANWYWDKEEYAAALSFYLRVTECSKVDLSIYESLLKAGLCLEKQGNRTHYAKGMYQHAISLLPMKPEGYFLLSRIYEKNKEWQESYTTAEIGLLMCKNGVGELSSVEYPGEYGFLFQKSVVSWWMGRINESLSGFLLLRNQKDVAMEYKIIIEKNIDIISSKDLYFAEFNTDKYIREHHFPNLNETGIMVEVGAGPPTFISNSKHFRKSGWRTICVEPNPKFIEQHKAEGSEVYGYACSNNAGIAEFIINLNNDNWYTNELDGVSFSSLGIRHKGLPEHNTQTKIQVEIIKLDTLLSNLGINKVDILSIDTEGWEIEVLEGFHIKKYNPKVIVLENIETDIKYEVYMNNNGYFKETSLGHNEIYIKAVYF